MRGKVLLGWLAEADAIRYLREDCIFEPPLNDQQARALWEERKAAVDALGRHVSNPPHLQLTTREREVATRFLKHHRKIPNSPIREVIKLDPMGLVVRQLDINLDRASVYMLDAAAATWCIHNCLTTNRPDAKLPMSVVPSGGWNFSLPHAEFVFIFNGKSFGIIQGLPQVSVSVLDDRSVLWAGYHRSFARASIVSPDAIDRTLLAALTVEGNVAVGPGSTNAALRDIVLGERPPLLGDFFDERLCMEVELHKKRYELQVRATLERIDAD